METKKVEFFNKLSFVTLLVTIFGVLFFFIPYIPVTLEASKGFLLSIGATLSLFFWLIARLGEGKFSLPKDRLILLAGLIPLVFLVSSFFSSSIYVSLFGSGFEIGTFGTILILFITFFLSVIHFQTEERLWYFYGALLFGAAIVSLIGIINIFIGFDRFLPGLLQGVSSGNLIGSWNNFAIFFGLVVILSVFTIEFVKTNKLISIVKYFLLVSGLFFLIIINLPLVWYLVGLFSVIIFVYSISMQHAGVKVIHGGDDKKKFPFAALIVVLVCIIFLISNNSIGNLVSKYINVSNTDVRPSFVTTTKIAYQSLKHNPAFGTGPNTFSMDWALWQPKDIAQTQYWNVDFSNGFSLIQTFLVTTGILGFVAFLLFMVVFLIRGIQSLRIALQNTLSNYFIFTTFMISVYTWIIVLIYNPNIVMLMLAFVSSGILISILVYKQVIPVKHFSFLNDPRNSFFAILGLMILMIATLSVTYIYIEKFSSIIYFSNSLKGDSSIESLSNSEKMLLNAINLDKNDVYYRTLSQVYIGQISVLISDKTISQDVLKNSIQQLVNYAQNSANAAVSQNPKQYLNYVNLGNVYSSLVSLPVTNSYESAVAAYSKASELAPNNPSVILNRASLEVLNKNNNEARKFIKQAMDLKLNYTDALFLLAQIETNEGNIAGAIKQVEYATKLNPGDPTIYFRLGLLRYNNSDFNGAIESFKMAATLDPSYLNAYFFLGKSYEKAGRKSEALEQFKALATVLPDNQDVKDALSSLTRVSPPVIEEADDNDTSGVKTKK